MTSPRTSPRPGLFAAVLRRLSPALVIGLACSAALAAEGVNPEAIERARLPPAPDGVRYLNRDSYEAMQEKSVSGNLLKNGSFERGRWWPGPWDPCDKLGTMWVDGGTDGKKCVRVDTNILEEQWLKWNEEVLKLGADAAKQSKDGDAQSLPADPVPAAPARLPTKPPFYDTVGGNHGIHYRSEFVKFIPGAVYRFSCDARGAGEPMVFVKGFFDQRRVMEGGEMVLKRNSYRAEMTLSGTGPEWRRFARVFHPSRSKSTVKEEAARVDWLRVELYAYWPVGVYEFDNVRLDILGYEKPEKPDGPSEKEDGIKLPAGEDEFPVIK